MNVRRWQIGCGPNRQDLPRRNRQAVHPAISASGVGVGCPALGATLAVMALPSHLAVHLLSRLCRQVRVGETQSVQLDLQALADTGQSNGQSSEKSFVNRSLR